MWLIAGLGNPGPKYELTRHNVGFLTIDQLAARNNCQSMKNSFSAETARIEISGEPCVLLKPQTFMNSSGISVQQAMSFHKIDPQNILIIHDELDIPFGEIKLKVGGGHGGHNGLRDISRLIGPNFIRLRMGIGRPNIKGTESNYVLKNYSQGEIKTLEEQLFKGCEIIETVLSSGITKAQNSANKKP
jgi:PTH1 family peptidyl-tRNA hydrolase